MIDQEHAQLILKDTLGAAQRVLALKRFPEGSAKQEVYRATVRILEELSRKTLTVENVTQLSRLHRQLTRTLGSPTES